MSNQKDTIIVFTARSPQRIIREGGSQAWILNPIRAKQCKWVVCTQNRHHPDHTFSDATEPHGLGFLLGKISDVRPSPEVERDDRWLIAISEYAHINIPDLWDHGRNPVRYTSLEELGINLDRIEFQLMPKGEATPIHPKQLATGMPKEPLTIADAKKGLAATFGVKPDAVEITIRG